MYKTLQVTVHKTHYGHKTSLGHLRIPESNRLAIAGQLASGVEFQHILDNIRDSLGAACQRIHLLTRKDIANIQRTYCLRGIERHKDDATSVHLWVESMKVQKDNPVLLYKPQGQVDAEGLATPDFVLALQTQLQADILRRFSQNRVVCVDGTHGTNGYDFTLITVMVIDEYGEGFPVAWCISNREDQGLLLRFYQAIRTKVGILTPAWFMSDLAEQFYSAWIQTFGKQDPPKRLLCAWHVDKAWRENLKQFKDDHTKVTIYHNLRLLLEETDINKFNIMLHQTLLNLRQSSTTVDFANYFERHYCRRTEQWAACFRKSSLVNTNMYVEAFHRVLKYVYMRGKVNKRLDKCIGILLKLARDKGFERLVKLEKGKTSERISQIQSRHRTSLKMPLSLVRETEEYKTWEIEASDGTTSYHVTLLNQQCPFDCLVACPDCNICVHTYSCNCADALIKATICKHIHLLVKYLSAHGHHEDYSQTQEHGELSQEEPELLASLQDVDTHDLSSFRAGINQQLSTLAGHLHAVTDISTLKDVKSLLTSALSVIKVGEGSAAALPVPTRDPPNKCLQTQRPFFSTKRKRKSTRVRLSKPSKEEKMNICRTLLTSTKQESTTSDSEFLRVVSTVCVCYRVWGRSSKII